MLQQAIGYCALSRKCCAAAPPKLPQKLRIAAGMAHGIATGIAGDQHRFFAPAAFDLYKLKKPLLRGE